jgi:TPR repeat protein
MDICGAWGERFSQDKFFHKRSNQVTRLTCPILIVTAGLLGFIPNAMGSQKNPLLLAQAPKGSTEKKKESPKEGFSEALNWFQKSAQKGNRNAQHMLGLMYYDGDGVKRDYTKAKIWFEKAAGQNHDSAQYMLGLIYYYGRGIKQNFGQATKWFEKAASQNHNSAQYMLGLIYYDGKGVKKNLTEAESWFRKAAKQGDEDAQYMIGLVIYEKTKGNKSKKP